MTNYLGRRSVLGAHKTQAVLDTTETKISESKVPDATFVDKTWETTDTTSTIACEEDPTSSPTAETAKEENAMLNLKETINITSSAITEVAVEESTAQVTEERETETVLGVTGEIVTTDPKEEADLSLAENEHILMSGEATVAEDAELTVSKVKESENTANETSDISEAVEPKKEEPVNADINAAAVSEEEKSGKSKVPETATESTCVAPDKETFASSDEKEEEDDGVHVVAVYRDMDTQEVEFDIKVGRGAEQIRFKSPLDEIPDKIRARGRFLSGKEAKQLQEDIASLYSTGKVEVVRTFNKDLGWDIYPHADGTEELIFRGSEVISNKLNAEYNGDLDIKPIGETKSMIEAMKDLILRNKFLMFWIISGLVASTLGYLRRCGESLQTIIIDAFGDTGSGKTTVAKLAVAMGCNPDPPLEKETFAYDFNSTVAAMYEKLNNNFGFPVLIDDVATSSKKTELLPFLYSCANGVGRGRYKEVKGRWSTVIVITNETSLLTLIDNTDGILIRILSIGDDSFTQSAEEARAVEEFCRSYHGLPIQLFSQALFRQNKDEMINVFRKLTDKAKEKLTLNNNLKERAARIVAVYKITATIAKQELGIPIDVKWIGQFLLRNLNQSTNRDSLDEIYDYFLEYVENNKDLFHSGSPKNRKIYPDTLREAYMPATPYHDSKKKVGYITYTINSGVFVPEYIVISQNRFDSWIKDIKGTGFDISKLLKRWSADDILVKVKGDRYVRAYKINESGSKINCYKIRSRPDILKRDSLGIDDLISEDDEDSSAVPASNGDAR